MPIPRGLIHAFFNAIRHFLAVAPDHMTPDERVHESESHFGLVVVAENVFSLEDYEVLLKNVLLILDIDEAIVFLIRESLWSRL